MKESTCRVEKMETYYEKVYKPEERYDGIELHILRCDNEEADALAKLVLILKFVQVFSHSAWMAERIF
jgi:hypothetical protein